MKPRSLIGAALLGLSSCNRSEPVRVDPAPSAAPPVPAAVASAEPPRKEIAWQPPEGALAPSEQALVGTWAATVGEYATRSSFMADKVLIGTPDGGSGISGIVDAIQQDNRLKTNCIWLELFDTRKGIRRECAVVNGQASALDKTDPFTGVKSDFGTTFVWYYDQPARSVRIRFDADMLVPSASGGAIRQLRFRTWVLVFGEKAGDDGFKMKETIPEHEYELPTQYVYEIFPGRFLGKP